jgi:acyl-coenzyme A thioesterase PaaI-like protein
VHAAPLGDPGAPEYPVLAAAVRRLLDAAVDARTLDATALHDVARELDAVSSRLEAAREAQRGAHQVVPFDGQRAPMPQWDYDARDDALVARGLFTNGHTGPPGTVHGGWIAFAFDEVLGWANVHARRPGMTGKLTIRYRRPTPVGVPVEFRVPWPRVEGRRVHTRGTLSANGAVTAEAEALFVHLSRQER